MPKPHFEHYTQINIDRALRVNHAGEYAACRICEGQIDGSRSGDKEKFFDMLVQEREHLAFFNKELVARKIRPTVFISIWDKLSYALGYFSSRYSLKIGMLAVEAIENVIEQHYADQIPLLNKDVELQKTIKKFQEDETSHKNHAKSHYNHSHLNILESYFFKCVQSACKVAISISKRV